MSNTKQIRINMQSEAINVSSERLWEIVGTGFENAGEWSTAVDHSIGSGSPKYSGATCDERRCDLNAPGFNKITEKISRFDEQNKLFSYDIIDGFPGFVTYANNLWEVIDLGNSKSALKMTITMEMKKLMGTLMGGMMQSNINKTIPTIFRDLKVYAETGNISKEKAQRMNKLSRKAA